MVDLFVKHKQSTNMILVDRKQFSKITNVHVCKHV